MWTDTRPGPPTEPTARPRWGRRWALATLSFLLVVLGVPLAAPAFAVDLLQVDKIVDNAAPRPGEIFTYTIQMSCSEEDCLNARLTDTLPAQLAGFTIVNATFSPDEASVPRTVVWTPGNTPNPPAVVGTDTGFTVDFVAPTSDPVGFGMVAGKTFTVTISLRVPPDFPPGTSPDIVNTATVSADNADTEFSQATIVIDSPVSVSVAVDKSWLPASQPFAPGSPSTIGLDARNTSNVAVDSLTTQEPKTAPPGATSLDASNPFTITDLTGFGAASLPTGCDQVQVDAYVETGGTWDWVAGTPVATPTTLALPPGVTNADVGGTRITCTGNIAPGATLSVDLGLAQRATHRDDGSDLSTDVHTVDNVATGAVAVAGQDPVTDDGTATYTVTPLIPTAEASKNIQPARITAGQASQATIAGTNGDQPVTELHVSDLGFFTDETTFGGFTAPPGWPASATAAAITYHHLDGSSETHPFAQGDTPAAPVEPISGFEITWTGPIDPNESGTAAFAIDTTESATGGAPEVTLTNTVDVTVTASNGLSDDATASDDLAITNPDVDVTIDKQVRPSTPVEPGDTVISSLETRATATGDGAAVHDVVIEDAWGGTCDGFWNAFDVTAIAPTQVPADTVLTVEVQDAGGVWHQLASDGPQPAATVFQLTQPEFAAALAGLSPPLTSGELQGVRFSFHDDDGFPADVTVTPHVVFTARSDLRDLGCPTPSLDTPIVFTNTATVDADGESAGGNDLHADDSDSSQGTVVFPTGGGSGPGVEIAKDWDRIAVSSQSGQQAATVLRWSVDDGMSPVTITDTAGDPATTPVADTVFDAFDLVRLDPVEADPEPFSSGWYLKYDTVTRVELHIAGSGWQEVPAPGGTWMQGSRGFKGYTLSAAERSTVTGIRITLQETAADTAARLAARQVGPAFDPFAPAPNSGVGAGSTDRTFNLVWQVRDTTRSDGSFVIEERTYNTPDEGVVDNSVAVDGTPTVGGPIERETAADTILILDPEPVVEVQKTVTPTQDVYTPPIGTPAAEYPTATWSISGHNASTARASYVRITDPATCTDTTLADCASDGTPAAAVADPFDTAADYLTNPAAPNPFESFDATRITIAASVPAQVDLGASVAWLLRFSGGAYTTEQTTAAQVNAMTEAQLADVVGISVTFQGSNPTATGGTISQDNNLTIVVESRLRTTIRSSGDPQVLAAPQTQEVTNRVFAQSYDPVTSPGQLTGDVADAVTVLTGGIVNIAPTKSVTPGTITEPEHDAGDDAVTVTLGANQGANPRSTLSPARVVIEDQAGSPEFWNAFAFTGLGAVTLPNGANQVQVDLYDGTQWHLGTPGPIATLPPGVANADVQGIRFTFSRADGGLFSGTVPAPNWAASGAFSAQLRDTYRDSGTPVQFPSQVTNTQTSQSTRPDGNDSEPTDATATVVLTPGTHELEVNKLTNGGNRLASVGEDVPFDLTIRNSGSGYVTLTELRDVLPDELVYTGDPAPVYTAQPPPQGALSEDVTLTASPDGSTLTFTWPAGGNRMLPGETFQIRLYLQLQPGLGTGETATNTMTAQTEEDLTRCANTEPGGTTTGDWAQDVHTCGTSDYVGAVTGPNLYTVKGVRGSLPGAYQPGNPGASCPQSLNATGGAYYRAPCVAHSELGGTDDWVLSTANAGTVNVDQMTIFDQLPVAGDRQLISGNSRGSQYRPRLVPGSLQVNAPAGTTIVTEVTTSADVCVGTWANLQTEPVCEQQGEVWTVADGTTDWSQVSGIRVQLDFTTTAAGSLRSGQTADVTYSTTNQPWTPTDPSGASTTVPGADQLAWNQFGVKYRYTGAAQFSKIAPSRVGVHLRFGSIGVVKVVTGPAAEYAPDEFLVDVSCTVDGAPLDLGSAATLSLSDGNGFTARVDGIPLSATGTTCTVEEQGPLGRFGETSRAGSPTTLVVTEPTDPSLPTEDQDVPQAQVATVTNDYQFTGLSVTKQVSTPSVGPVLGPFTFTLSCTTASGMDVTFDDSGTTDVEFSLEAGETFTAPADRIPVGATCQLAETDSFFVDHVVITGDNVVDNGDGTATVTPGIDPVEVVVTNAYEGGTVTLAKVVDGDGADRYGTGTFSFDISCRFHGTVAFDDEVRLRAGDTRTLGPFPVGTECVVVEVDTGGASATSLDPEHGTVTVPAPAQQGELTDVRVTATNTFDLTSLDVVKQVRGDLSAEGAAGPFTVSLRCSWRVDGVLQPVAVPGGATRELARHNDFRARYSDLPDSSVCVLTEVDSAGADNVVMVAHLGDDVLRVEADRITLDLGNKSGPGDASVSIVNRFDTDDASGPGSDGSLPNTGSRFGPWLAVIAGLLIASGGALLLTGRTGGWQRSGRT